MTPPVYRIIKQEAYRILPEDEATRRKAIADLRRAIADKLDEFNRKLGEAEGKPGQDGRNDFYDLFEVWLGLGITAETIESFREIVDGAVPGEDELLQAPGRRPSALSGPIYNRFLEVTRRLADLAISRGHLEDGVYILKSVVHTVIGETLYGFDMTTPLLRRYSEVCDLPRQGSVSAALFRELEGYLTAHIDPQGNPQQRSLKAIINQSACFYNPGEHPSKLFDVTVPASVEALEGETLIVPIHLNPENPSVQTGPLDVIISFPESAFEYVRLYNSGYRFSNFVDYCMTKDDGTRVCKAVVHNPSDKLELDIILNRIVSSHWQHAIPFKIEFIPRDVPALAIRKEMTIHVKNVNEPPQVRIEGHPQVVREGTEICLEADISDPEGDPFDFRWNLKRGNAASRRTEDGKFCVTPKATHRFETPLDIELSVTDRVDDPLHPGLSPATSVVSTRLYVEPENLQLPTGERASLPASVIKTITGADLEPGVRGDAAAMATGSYLYVFLRLPGPAPDYEARIESQIASALAVTRVNWGSLEGNTKRIWSGFQRVPQADENVVVSVSPIQRWTESGTYHFDHPSRITAQDVREGYTFTIPIRGGLSIHTSEVRVSANMEVDAVWSRPWTYRLSFDNVKNVDGRSFLQPVASLPIKAEVTYTSRAGKLVLSRELPGRLVSPPDAEKLVYEFSFYLAKEYVPEGTVELSFDMTNDKGDVAHFKHKMETPSSFFEKSLFDSFGVSLDPGYIPLPWYLIRLRPPADTVALSTKTLLPTLQANFFTCPPDEAKHYIHDCSNLAYQMGDGNVLENGEIGLPMSLRSEFDGELALAYRGIGERISGSIDFRLSERPDEVGDPRQLWRAQFFFPPAAMVIPKARDLKLDWGCLNLLTYA